MAEAHPSFDDRDQLLEFSGAHYFIFGDRFALTTLLQNLLSNANKYTPDGGDVRVALMRSDSAVTIVVEDSGPGIPVELRNDVFERFYRVGGDRHSSWQPGSGLGLAIAKGIADLHGASLSITESSFATGAAFQVSFPRNRPNNDHHSPTSKAGQPS